VESAANRVETVGGHQFGNPITFNNILQLSGREASRPSCTAGKHFNFDFHNASDSAQVTAHHVNHHVLHLKLMIRLIPNEVLNIMDVTKVTIQVVTLDLYKY